MVAHAQDAEAERAHGPLGAVDRAQRLGLDRRAVGDARGQARARRLLRARHAERAGERAHLGLADAGLEQRMDDAVLGRGAQAGPPVAVVVGVRAREQRRVAAPRGERRERVVELGLAVVAAVGAVAR